MGNSGMEQHVRRWVPRPAIRFIVRAESAAHKPIPRVLRHRSEPLKQAANCATDFALAAFFDGV